MPPDSAPPSAKTAADSRYAARVLTILTVVYIFNFVDRQILSILAEEIRLDLGLTDAQLGFLYGTAFAVFYAIFGIPLGRLADVWDRRKLIAAGLAFWSVMTVLSGGARTFSQLAVARFGVGIGEASATPAAYSLLCDYFSVARRATALAIYSSGIYIGVGLSLFVGGQVVGYWDTAFAGAAPWGLRGWQVAFFVVGLPGLLLALVVRRIREPIRGVTEGVTRAVSLTRHPFRVFGRELLAMLLPPLHLLRLDAGRAQIMGNLLAIPPLVAFQALCTAWLGDPAQWWALVIGLYLSGSWAQGLAIKDPPAFALLFRAPTFLYVAIAFGCMSFVGYGVKFWTPAFFLRVHDINLAEAGLYIGGASALGGWLGITLGGFWADRWRKIRPEGRLLVPIIGAVGAFCFGLIVLFSDVLWIALAATLCATIGQGMWLGPGAATVQDLVLPRMRATAAAVYLLFLTMIGLLLGPYLIGRLSVMFGTWAYEPGDALRYAMVIGGAVNLIGIGFTVLACRNLVRDESRKMERARAAGEPDIS